MEAGGISGDSRGNHPPTKGAVYLEVGGGGKLEWIGQDCRETDQTGVGDVHGKPRFMNHTIIASQPRNAPA